MTRFEDCRRVGRIGKPHGHGGEVKLELLPDIETDLDLEEPVFLLIEGKPVPFFITSCNEQAQPPILHFEDCSGMDAARRLQGMEIFVPASAVIGDSWDTESLIGYAVHHPENGLCGTVAGIQASGLQELLVLKNDQGEFLLPLQEELIINLDEEKQSLTLNFPIELIGEDYL